MSEKRTTEYTCDKCLKVQLTMGNRPKDWCKAELHISEYGTSSFDLCDNCHPFIGSLNECKRKQQPLLSWFLERKYFRKASK